MPAQTDSTSFVVYNKKCKADCNKSFPKGQHWVPSPFSSPLSCYTAIKRSTFAAKCMVIQRSEAAETYIRSSWTES